MIRHVRLLQWRSYEALDLDFDAGTTFIVAPNGVGKTSLVLGLAWGVFGDNADFDARGCIRAGADTAEVEVTLLLPGDEELVITRRIGRRGRPTVAARLDGNAIDETSLADVLAEAFAVDLHVAARLSMMLGGGQLASHKPLDLKSHLYTAFGVADLLWAAEQAEKAAKEAEKQRAAVRAVDQGRLADRAGVEAQIAQLRARVEEHSERRIKLQAEVRAADHDRTLAGRSDTYDEQRLRYERARDELAAIARALMGRIVEDTELEQALRAARQEAELAAEREAEAYAEARGSIAAANEALRALTSDAAHCPTCLRPLDAEELSAAQREHEHRVQAATDASQRHAGEQAVHRERVAAIADVLTRLDTLRPPTPPERAVDAAEAAGRQEAALRALEAHDREAGGLEAQLLHIASQLAADDRLAESEQALYLAYRREAITAAAARAFRQAVVNVTQTLIEPVATEVTWRWKQLFNEGGLTLRSDGSIVREQAGEELGWSTLSDGERIWARIVTHLLVIASSTRLPFVWLDEPLEHLDPQLRHAVAATLASATEGGNPRQLLVTTYEHALARQLADDTPDAALINVRAAQREAGPRGEPTTVDEPASEPTRRAS